MISVVIGAILAALFAGLLIIRVRYGSLRLSELPALLWCLLSGPDHRRQLRVILSRRPRHAVSVTADEVGIRIAVRQVPRIDPQVAELRAAMDDLAERATARMPSCSRCKSPHTRSSGLCLPCFKTVRRQGVGSVSVTYTTTGEAHASRGGGAGGSSSAPNLPHPGGNGGIGGINPYGPIAAHLRGLPVGWPEDDELGES